MAEPNNTTEPPIDQEADLLAKLEPMNPKALLLITGSVKVYRRSKKARLKQLFNWGLAQAARDTGAVVLNGVTDPEWAERIDKSMADRGGKSVRVDKVPIDKLVQTVQTLEAKAAAKKISVATILVGGDGPSKDVALKSIRQRWPIVVVQGSGGIAGKISRRQRLKKGASWLRKKLQKRLDYLPFKLDFINPPLIRDEKLSEIVGKGKIHLFPLKNPPGALKDRLVALFPRPTEADTILRQAWYHKAKYGLNAQLHQNKFKRRQFWILALGVIAVLLALFQTQFYGTSAPTPPTRGNLFLARADSAEATELRTRADVIKARADSLLNRADSLQAQADSLQDNALQIQATSLLNQANSLRNLADSTEATELRAQANARQTRADSVGRVYRQAQLDYPGRKRWYDRLHLVLIFIPIVLSILLAGVSRFKSGNKWILLRSAAESIKREIYSYRAQARAYTDEATRDARLAEQVKSITDKMMRSVVNEAGLEPYDGPIPPKMYGAAGKDKGDTVLTAKEYIDIRINDQLNYFGPKTKSLEQKLKRLQWSIYIIGGVGTFLAAVGFELWVALTTAVAAAFATYLEYNQTDTTLKTYNQVAIDLNNIKNRWLSLDKDDREKKENKNLLVEQTEKALEDELSGWVKNMTDVLAALQEKQAKELEERTKRSEEEKEKIAKLNNVVKKLAAGQKDKLTEEEKKLLEKALAEEEKPDDKDDKDDKDDAEPKDAPEPKDDHEPKDDKKPDDEAKDDAADAKDNADEEPVLKTLTEADYIAAAGDLGIGLAAMKAVAEVEAGGSGFEDDKPKILFEGHIFWRQLKKHGVDPAPLVAGNENVLHKKATRQYYVEDQYARLEKAKKVSEDAALESASWGMFQILGYHWENLGYDSVKNFVELMYKSEGEHLKAFAAFVEANGLVTHLKTLDWAKFARGYNGPGYATNKYDTKMADAYKKHKG